jgi:hypothetical protein
VAGGKPAPQAPAEPHHVQAELGKFEDQFPGGLADKRKPEDFDPKELELGIEHEMGEHTQDRQLALELVMDHLAEDPHYYSRKSAAGEMTGSPATQEGGITAKSAGPIPGSPAHHHLNLPAGSQVNGKIKVRHEDGSESWVMATSGMVQSQDPTGHPASAREPGAR